MNIVEINRRLMEIRTVVDSKGRGRPYPPKIMEQLYNYATEAKGLVTEAGDYPSSLEEIVEAINTSEQYKEDEEAPAIRIVNDAVGSLLLGIDIFLNKSQDTSLP